MVIDWRCQLVGYPGEVLTDMDYSIYPEGFYTVCLQDFLQSLRLLCIMPSASIASAYSCTVCC